MSTGTINVQTENIFPLIKKFLYTDTDIFLRELISNATDATTKLNVLSAAGEVKGDLGDLKIEVIVDEKAKTITIKDKGIGMTADEVDRFINQIAFSGAEEFVKKYKDKKDADANIIGHFGLGFYSSFMVAEKVEIITKSYNDEPACHWSCDGSPEYDLKKHDRSERGTDVILHIEKDSKEYLQKSKVQGLLSKFCKFMPIEIKFGTNERTEKKEAKEAKDGEEAEEIKIVEDNIINNTTPAWTKKPASLKEEDYKSFYREVYPMNFEEPLFHIHLNVDYPFNLTGILYFPKLKNQIEVQKDKIQLYSNQVFVTDSVEGIVPEFLMLLHGVLDSPDIPLNVSRSSLQSDGNVKKISSHITKKVADKLAAMFKKDRKDFEAKWDDIKIFIDYGMLTDDKFYEKAEKFALLKNLDGEFFTFEEYKKKIEKSQTDKDKRLVILYTNNKEEQHSYIKAAKDRGYDVIEFESPLSSHLIQKLEQKMDDTSFVRVDGDTIDKLIKKDEEIPSKLTEKDEGVLKPVFEGLLSKEKFMVQFESMNESDAPITITQSEFMRRMKEQSAVGGGMMGMGSMPDMYNVVVNGNHPLISKILDEKNAKKKSGLAKQATDLALLSQGMLKGEELTTFINRSINLIK